MQETQRTSLNSERLLLVDLSIRNQVSGVLCDLESCGLRPLIASGVWRDPKEQYALYKKGVSKVTWGFHCATTPEGKPGSLAADIVDADRGWEVGNEFWLRLGNAARIHGLNWGGFFGLAEPQRIVLRKAFLTGDPVEYFKHRDIPLAQVKRGWDPAHVETARVTIAQAKRGER